VFFIIGERQRTLLYDLLSVICNSNSFQSILLKLCTVFAYILKMCTSYYGLIWRFCWYIFCMLNLVIFYHYMSWTVPSWCNLKLQQCSINIIQTLHSVCKHIEDVYLLLWADLTIFFFNFLYVELSHFFLSLMTLMVPSWCNLKCHTVIKNYLSSTYGKCTQKIVKSAHNRRCTSSICTQTLCKV
jgi:hypothetical protein